MNYSVAFPAAIHHILMDHLARADRQEDICFALWSPSTGRTRTTALLHQVLLPDEGDRQVHGNASFNPQFVERVLGLALESGAGVAMLHSHPCPGWQRLSQDDYVAESGLAPAFSAATGLPFLGLTVGATDGTWSARFWKRSGQAAFEPAWAESVRVVGSALKVDWCDDLRPRPIPVREQDRTRTAWGDRAQDNISRLTVGIVGLGSVGSIVADALARTGVGRLVLLDHDTLKTENLDRTVNAFPGDVGQAKVQVQEKSVLEAATTQGFECVAEDLSICEPEGHAAALDCDVIFSCVDRPWPRSVLNSIAYAHLIPVIDGGIKVFGMRGSGLRGADWKAHVVTIEHRCLLCREQYNPAFVQMEREGHLDDPSYLEGLPADSDLLARQNVLAFSMGCASLELCQFIMLVITAAGIGADFAQNYHLVTGTIDVDASDCEAGCEFPQIAAMGDRAPHPGTSPHAAAQKARTERRQAARNVYGRQG